MRLSVLALLARCLLAGLAGLHNHSTSELNHFASELQLSRLEVNHSTSELQSSSSEVDHFASKLERSTSKSNYSRSNLQLPSSERHCSTSKSQVPSKEQDFSQCWAERRTFSDIQPPVGQKAARSDRLAALTLRGCPVLTPLLQSAP